MDKRFEDVWRKVRAYLRLLLGRDEAADMVLSAFLEHSIARGHRPDDLRTALRMLHRWLPPAHTRTPVGRGAGRGARHLLDWQLSGFSFRERALIVLSSLPGLTADDAQEILGMPPDEALATLADAERRIVGLSAIVAASDMPLACGIAAAVRSLGIRQVRLTSHISGLRTLVAAQRPSVVVADLGGSLAPDAVEAVLRRPVGQHIPSVVLAASSRTPSPSVSLRKPFSQRALQLAVLNALSG